MQNRNSKFRFCVLALINVSKLLALSPETLVDTVDSISRKFHSCETFYIDIEDGSSTASDVERCENVYEMSHTAIQAQQASSAGVFVIVINPNNKAIFEIDYNRFQDVHRFTGTCGLAVFRFCNEESRNLYNITYSTLFRLLTPLYGPIIRKDEDYFIFITRNKALLQEALLSEDFGNKIKYKIGLYKNSPTKSVSIQTVDHYGNDGYPLVQTMDFTSAANLESSSVTSLFPDRMNNFNGKCFRMSIPKAAFRFETTIKNGKVVPHRGYYKWWLDAVEVKFNFTYIMFESSFGGGTGKVLSNGTLVGAAADVLEGKADWAFVIGHILSRHKFVEWSGPLSYEWMVFLNHKPRTFLSPKAIFWPFTPFMWTMFLVTLIIVPLILKLIAKGNRYKFSYLTMFEYVYATVLEQDHSGPYAVPLDSVRILGAFWLLFSMIISVAYRGKLVALLAFPVETWMPRTFEELANSQFQVALNVVGKGGAAYSILSSSPSPIYKKLFERMEFYPNADECLAKAVKLDLCCIMWEGVAAYMSARNITDRFGNNPLQPSAETTSFIADGLIWEKRAIFRKHLDTTIWNAIEMGLVPRWFQMDQQLIKSNRWKMERERIQNGNSSVADVTHFEAKGPEKLKVNHFKGVFLILAGGIVISWLDLLVELMSLWKLHGTTSA